LTLITSTLSLFLLAQPGFAATTAANPQAMSITLESLVKSVDPQTAQLPIDSSSYFSYDTVAPSDSNPQATYLLSSVQITFFDDTCNHSHNTLGTAYLDQGTDSGFIAVHGYKMFPGQEFSLDGAETYSLGANIPITMFTVHAIAVGLNVDSSGPRLYTSNFDDTSYYCSYP